MTEPKDALTRDVRRRSVIKAAAWTAPVVAAAAVVPKAAASVPPVKASSIGARTDSPNVGDTGHITPTGIDPNGDPGFFPAGQTFTLTSSDLDFDSIVTSVVGGTLTKTGQGSWLITPNAGVTSVDIKFRSTTTGSYVLTSNGPVMTGNTWNGAVHA